MSQVCHCWCLLFSAGPCSISIHCLPGVSVLVSAFLLWPCSISVHLSPRCVIASVRPFPLAMQHFNSFVFVCLPRFSACTAGVRSAGHATFLCICFPCGLFTVVFPGSVSVLLASALSPFQHFYSFVSQMISALPQTGYY